PMRAIVRPLLPWHLPQANPQGKLEIDGAMPCSGVCNPDVCTPFPFRARIPLPVNELACRHNSMLYFLAHVVSVVTVAQLVESRIVIPVVVGSSPIGHPRIS